VQAFSELFEELDATTATGVKVAAMVRYFRTAAAADAAWAAYILSGRRLKRFIGPTLLYRWLVEAAALPEWLIEESVAAVGDMAETIALLMENTANVAAASDVALAEWIEGRLLPLRAAPVEEQHAAIVNWWRTLPYRECFILNKLLTGELRVGVSALLVTRAIAETVDVPRADIVRRLMGEWQPSKSFWEGLASHDLSSTAASTPYPFFLASPTTPRHSGTLRAGRSNGNGTASARSSSGGLMPHSSGHAAKTSSRSVSRKSPRRPRSLRMARCSMASSSPGRMASCNPSRCCNSASAARN